MYLSTSHPKFKQMMKLLTQTDQQGYRHNYAWIASKQRTESTRELTEKEVDEIIKVLQTNFPEVLAFTPKPGDKQRKMIIGIAKDMQWHVKGKKDLMRRIDSFMLKRTKYKKKLNDLTEDELNKVCTIFETQVKADYYKSL
jgi:hypothetical protein